MSDARIKHGMSSTPVYQVWTQMLSRCQCSTAKSYTYYGGRGIEVCARWQEFQAFLDDMGEPGLGQSLDRIDNDGPYSPENCRWANKTTQARNQRNTTMLYFRGERKPLTQWAEELGLKDVTIRARLRRGWTVERALSEVPHD